MKVIQCSLLLYLSFVLKLIFHYFEQTAMPGMKADCGGAAAILGAFKAAVKQVKYGEKTSSIILHNLHKFYLPFRVLKKICMPYFAWLKMLLDLILQDLMIFTYFIRGSMFTMFVYVRKISTFLIHSILFFRSVEINNTDAEGRLALGDGVS